MLQSSWVPPVTSKTLCGQSVSHTSAPSITPQSSFRVPATGVTSRRSVSSPTDRSHGRSHRIYRCSRCGNPGHNVRACPIPAIWFDQRCGHCGLTGHNIRNCPERLAKDTGKIVSKDASGVPMKCRVCLGRGKLPCSKCHGRVIDPRVRAGQKSGDSATPQLVSTGIITDMQKRMAEAVRRRARRLRESQLGNSCERLDLDDHLVGQQHSHHHVHGQNGTHSPPSDNGVHGKINGSIPDRVEMQLDKIASGDNGNVPCSRCMGTGYLTCMACC